MRRVPGTMATQHPDNACAPYWDKAGRPFVGVHEEITEAVACFKDLDVSEYMWDWEGKHADAAVIDRLFSDYYDYFSKLQLGRDKFLTFRIPNIWEEKGYNLLQAMTVVLSAEDLAGDLDFHGRPLFEIILPMTERAQQLMNMQKLFEKLARFKSDEFTIDQTDNTNYLEIIPLVESVQSQLGVGELLDDYVRLHEQHFKRRPEYIRAFLACSDSSLSAGLLAGLIGNKVGLSRLYEFSDTSGIPVFPIAGSGSLLFRGGLAPDSVDRFVKEFPGVRTATVQSSFRYDHPKATVKRAIAELEKRLPAAKPRVIRPAAQARLVAIADKSTGFYQRSLDAILEGMEPIFNLVPRRRDRRQHIGLLAYSRSMGERSLPRAITFTAGFYSVGLPPEFIGLGRTLKSLKASDLELLKDEYPSMAADFERAGRFINKDNLARFARGSRAWAEILAGVEASENILGIQTGPRTKDEKAHERLSSQLVRTKDGAKGSELIDQMAVLRRSLG